MVRARQGLKVIHFFSSPAAQKELAHFQRPCLIVMGEHESLYNPQKAAKPAQAIPHARVEIVPEAAHAAIFDRPQNINPIILNFLCQRD